MVQLLQLKKLDSLHEVRKRVPGSKAYQESPVDVISFFDYFLVAWDANLALILNLSYRDILTSWKCFAAAASSFIEVVIILMGRGIL